MKKRIRKKRLRDIQPKMILRGNNGGDLVELIPMKNDRVCIRSGCSCVMTFEGIVPNEFLSILIEKCILEYGSVPNFLQNTGYDEDYKQGLIQKVQSI